jgi:hypothetical protein
LARLKAPSRIAMADVLGYAASLAVLASFLMRTMVPLRLAAILSNVLFLVFGYIQHIDPVFFLHAALLPINTWRLFAVRYLPGVQAPALHPSFATATGPRPLAFWFIVGLLAGVIGSVAVVAIASAHHI